jgi:hypothetical protein
MKTVKKELLSCKATGSLCDWGSRNGNSDFSAQTGDYFLRGPICRKPQESIYLIEQW